MIRRTLIGLLAGAFALVALLTPPPTALGQESGYRLAIHPVSGDCAYLNLAGANGYHGYTPQQARDAEACSVPGRAADRTASEAITAQRSAASFTVVESTVVVVDPVPAEVLESYQLELTAYRRAIANAEAQAATHRAELAIAEATLAGAPPSPSIRGFLQTIVDAQREALARALEAAEKFRAGPLPVAPQSVRAEITGGYMALDSDGDGVLEHHNCNGRIVNGRLVAVGYADDGITPLPFADALRASCGR